MATNKRILKLTNTEAIIKIDGDVGSATIDLQTDLLGPYETLIQDENQVVAITMMVVSGVPQGVVKISRNSILLYHLSVDACAVIDMQALGPFSDATLGTHDIVVETTVQKCELIIKLRKISGYFTRINPTGGGVYNNPTPNA